jgi:hypothetical protein
MVMVRVPGRDKAAVLAGLAAPLALAAVLVPYRTRLPNTDAALFTVGVSVRLAASWQLVVRLERLGERAR